MGYKQNRRIVRFGSTSRGIILPLGWLKFYKLQVGDKLVVLGNSVLVVTLPKDEEKARNLIELVDKQQVEV